MKIGNIICVVLMSFLLFGLEVKAEVSYEEPNGQNGYYKVAPTVVINRTEEGVTRYRLEIGNGKVLTGRLDSMMETVTIKKEVLKDGKNTLDVWREDEDGNMIEGSVMTYLFQVDQEPPRSPLNFTKNETLEISTEDDHSGVDTIFYAIEGEDFQAVKGSRIFVTLPEDFEGKICAYAVDNAGNQGEYSYFECVKKKEEVKIEIPEKEEDEKDNEAPAITLIGIEDFQISKEIVTIKCSVTDNQAVTTLSGKIICKNEAGEEAEYEITDWKKTKEGYEHQSEINETGIYQIHILAKDESGNEQKVHRHVIVDMNPPIIKGLEKWNEKAVTVFQWDYRKAGLIEDLTTTTYEVRLDGILYTSNKVFDNPGTHSLEVTATDLAGNETERTVTFYILNKEKNEENLENEADTKMEMKEEKKVEEKIEDKVEGEEEAKTEKTSLNLWILTGVTGILIAIIVVMFLLKKKAHS